LRSVYISGEATDLYGRSLAKVPEFQRTDRVKDSKRNRHLPAPSNTFNSATMAGAVAANYFLAKRTPETLGAKEYQKIKN